MTKVAIFNTSYEWNWLHTLNQFLNGVSWGAGVALVFLLFILFVNKSGTKTTDDEKRRIACTAPQTQQDFDTAMAHPLGSIQEGVPGDKP